MTRTSPLKPSMRRAMLPAAALFVALALSACINLGVDKDAPPVTHFVLEDLGRTVPAHTPRPLTLVVLDTQVSAFYDTDGMAYSDQAGTRSYYKYARWTERPGRRFTELLNLRLGRENLFAAVVGGGEVRGDWLLETELLEFYHDAASPPGKARMLLRADVVDLATRKLVGHKLFSASADLSSYDAAGAHEGFTRATTQLLSDLIDWLGALPAER
ncbi:MAG TPA: ABC-type transport auxiliary lipoprotein family protein [Thiobacillaceae bacterium]|nr:ABC-type transport auxiliary lipoprotein family protein [Thiobacillaceae bacterium]